MCRFHVTPTVPPTTSRPPPPCNLCSTNLQQLARRIQSQVRSDYARIFPTLFRKCSSDLIRVQDFTLKDYTWAVSVVWSHFVSVKFGGRMLKCMVPFVDMFNHSNDAQTRGALDPKTRMFTVVTNAKVPAGRQVFLNYGRLPSSRLMLFKGFAMPRNPFERVEVFVSTSPQAELYREKKRVLAEHLPEDVQPFKVGRGLPWSAPPAVRRSPRFCAAPVHFFYAAGARPPARVVPGDPAGATRHKRRAGTSRPCVQRRPLERFQRTPRVDPRTEQLAVHAVCVQR